MSTEQNRKLAILVSLSLANQYKRPLADLRSELNDAGYGASPVKVMAECVWLEESGLVKVDRDREVVALTEDGLSVVMGDVQMPGVARPGPVA